MFDDRLFDVIMEEMMAKFGPEVRTDEGSLAYNACTCIAEKLEEIYGDMDELNDNMLPDTQDLDHLIRYARERGISYEYATAPEVLAVFHQEIEIGEEFACGEHSYTVTEQVEGYSYKMTCNTEGTEANATLGQLEPVNYVDEFQGGEITEILVHGRDDEDEEEFRARVYASFENIAFGGNKADYRNFINTLPGVGGCKPRRRNEESPIITVHLINSEFGVPSSELVRQVQEAVDPVEYAGEGEGMAPICHRVQIVGVQGVPVNVSTQITFDAGYSASTSTSIIENVIMTYISDLCSSWETKEDESIIVRIAQIEARILSVEGVLDIANTTLNGLDSNVSVPNDSVPVMGGVTIA